MVVLFNAGLQVPLIPLVEVVGSGVITSPEQTSATCVNVGINGELTLMVSVAVEAHWPPSGVKV